MFWVFVITFVGIFISVIFAGLEKRKEIIDRAQKLTDDPKDKIIISQNSHHNDTIR